MGVNFHITRAEFWADNSDAQISSKEWLGLIEADAELSLESSNGAFHAVWTGEGSEDGAWLDWFEGNVFTKWPNTALYRKMLQISRTLNAKVMDEEGILYETEDAWPYEPKRIVVSSALVNCHDARKAIVRSNFIQRFLSRLTPRQK
jgi:hypothetical protein